MTAGSERGQVKRTDARRNRAHIIDVAREMLTASSDTSMNAIAKAAGVGPGTLYRHFPTREDLILAVYTHEVEQLADHAPALLEDHPPLEALRLWLDRLAHYGRIKHGLADVLHALTDERLAGKNYRLVIGAVTTLLDAGKGAGVIRTDADPDDVLLMLGFLWRVSPGPDGEGRADRLIGLVIDGLRHGAPSGPR